MIPSTTFNGIYQQITGQNRTNSVLLHPTNPHELTLWFVRVVTGDFRRKYREMHDHTFTFRTIVRHLDTALAPAPSVRKVRICPTVGPAIQSAASSPLIGQYSDTNNIWTNHVLGDNVRLIVTNSCRDSRIPWRIDLRCDKLYLILHTFTHVPCDYYRPMHVSVARQYLRARAMSTSRRLIHYFSVRSWPGLLQVNGRQ